MLQSPELRIDDETTLREYLLGRLPSEGAEALESELLDDEDLFEKVRIVETELYDDFAAGRLSATDQRAFLSRYSGRAARSRFVFATTLHGRTAAMRIATFRPRAARIVLAAAAIAVVAIGLAYLRMRTETPVTNVRQIARDVEPVERPTAVVASPVPAIAFTVTLGASRAAGENTPLSIPADAATVELDVRLHAEDVYDSYAVDVRDKTGRSVWQQSDVRATTAADTRTIKALIPAARLPAGTYEIAVSGRTGSAPAEELGFKSLEVRREQ
jgi:hypothetical protein